jgi:hypothetical protein
LNVAADKRIILTGGARADNVVWVVAGASFFDARSHFEGNMLGATAAVLITGSSIHGRVLVQTAVTLQSTTVTKPSTLPPPPSPPAPPSTTTNAGRIDTNAKNITALEASIATNEGSIAINEGSIATNADSITVLKQLADELAAAQIESIAINVAQANMIMALESSNACENIVGTVRRLVADGIEAKRA